MGIHRHPATGHGFGTGHGAHQLFPQQFANDQQQQQLATAAIMRPLQPGTHQEQAMQHTGQAHVVVQPGIKKIQPQPHQQSAQQQQPQPHAQAAIVAKEQRHQQQATHVQPQVVPVQVHQVGRQQQPPLAAANGVPIETQQLLPAQPLG